MRAGELPLRSSWPELTVLDRVGLSQRCRGGNKLGLGISNAGFAVLALVIDLHKWPGLTVLSYAGLLQRCREGKGSELTAGTINLAVESPSRGLCASGTRLRSCTVLKMYQGF